MAVKKMSNKTEKEYQMNLNEIKMLKKYGHPNIVKFHCCYTTKNEYYMVSELMEVIYFKLYFFIISLEIDDFGKLSYSIYCVHIIHVLY